MDETEKQLITLAIEQREDWQETKCEDPSDELWMHCAHAFEAFNTIIVLVEFSDRHTDDRQFLVWDRARQQLREATNFEDEILREYDNEQPLRDDDELMVFLIARETDNTLTRWER